MLLNFVGTMLLVASFGQAAAKPDTDWTYTGKAFRLSAVVDDIMGKANLPVMLTEPIPADARADLNISEKSLDAALSKLALQTPIRIMRPQNAQKRYIVWADGKPPKDTVRFYVESSTYHLSATDATIQAIVNSVTELSGEASFRAHFLLSGIDGTKRLENFSFEISLPNSPKPFDEFALRLIAKLLTPPASPPPTPPDEVQAVWNLTFLAGDPPNLDKTPNLSFSSAKASLQTAAIADAFNKAFATVDSKGQAVNPVTAIGNSLYIRSKRNSVNLIRKMLATQIDIPQSQIQLEIDAYQVTSNFKTAKTIDLQVSQIKLGQEIARSYKHAYLSALKRLIYENRNRIKDELKARSELTGIHIDRLFSLVGVDPDASRLLGQTEVLLFLAYCPADVIRSNYARLVKDEFKGAYRTIDSLLTKPMRDSKSPETNRLAETVDEVNRLFRDQAAAIKSKSALVHAFAQPNFEEMEDGQTRRAIEDFLILWIGTLPSNASAKLDDIDKAAADQRSPAQQAKGYCDTMDSLGLCFDKNEGNHEYKGHGSKSDRKDHKEAEETFWKALSGDRPSKLVRAGFRVDELLQAGVSVLKIDQSVLIDAPLRSWIESKVLYKSGDSRFGVKFIGTSALTVTSRAPGMTGATAESYFPFQPVSPISLDSLIPILSRKPVPEPEEGATDMGAKLARAGLTPQESLILQGIFDQAATPPYYRKLGAGLNFSVLPTMLSNGSTARLQVRLNLSVEPDGTNVAGAGSLDKPAPVDLLKSMTVETELLANSFDITHVSSLQMTVSAPGKRDWEIPILSQILPVRSWFVGPTQDKSVRHEAVVLVRVVIVPRAMDLASRFLEAGQTTKP